MSNFLVDGGFLIWTFGVDTFKWQGWTSAKWQYSTDTGAVIILDGGANHRIKYYPEYKSDRRERYAEDVERQKKKELVIQFSKDIIERDPILTVVRYPDFEADDILAAWCVRYPYQMKVIGTDKDLVQLGNRNIELYRHDGTHVNVEKFASRLQKTLREFVDSPEKILLTIALLGDKSDSVPRLVPSGIKNLRQFARILQSDNPWKQAIDFYNKVEVMRNLYLTILPGPWVMKDVPTPEKVLEMMIDEPSKYFGMPFRDDIEEGYQKYISEVKSDKDKTADELIKELGY